MKDRGLNPGNIIMFSGEHEESSALQKAWPDAARTVCNIGHWNLNEPRPSTGPGGDLGVICNTFMMARDPTKWLQHISEAVPLLLVQDLAVARRIPGRYCGDDGDCARYSVSSHGVIGKTDPEYQVFDFSTSGYEVLDCEAYGQDLVYEGGETGLKFVVLLRLR